MTTITDSFDRADNTDISTGGPITWTEVANDFKIASNQLRLTSTSVASTARAESTLSSADHYSQATIVQIVNSSSNHGGVITRFDASANTGYLLYARQSLSPKDIAKIVTGTITILAATTLTTLYQQLRLEVSGSGLTAIGSTDGTVGTVTDTAITGGVRCGIFLQNAAADRVAANNFEAGDLGATATFAPPFDGDRRMRRNVLVRM